MDFQLSGQTGPFLAVLKKNWADYEQLFKFLNSLRIEKNKFWLEELKNTIDALYLWKKQTALEFFKIFEQNSYWFLCSQKYKVHLLIYTNFTLQVPDTSDVPNNQEVDDMMTPDVPNSEGKIEGSR